jgi:hypothetical protein
VWKQLKSIQGRRVGPGRQIEGRCESGRRTDVL